MMEIEEDMAHRIAYQTILMKGAPKSCTKILDRNLGILPKEWMVVGDEWCDDHDINPIHGALALMHLQSLFGKDFGDVEIRVILDEAYERAKSANWYQ